MRRTVLVVVVVALAAACGSDDSVNASRETTTTEPHVMPDVVCMDLQQAQDTIQDEGVFLSKSHDATGRDRHQIVDSNWQVVAQSPAPGTPIGEGDAILEVVKYGEQPNPCP